MPNRREQEPPEDTLATTFKVGSALGPYLLLEKIGSGRLGSVFKGRHQTLQNDVAIKIHQYFPEDDFIGLAFKQSASFVAQMSHPNIVRVIGYGFHRGHAYMVMEYVWGTTLTDLMPVTFQENRSDRAEEWTHRAIEYATQLLAAVRYAHNCVYRDFNGNTVVGIMHGDIKPANVLVSRESGKLKLTDFMIPDVQAFLGNRMKVRTRRLFPGPSNTLAPAELAILSERLTEPITALFGTPEYMAPEQWKGRVTIQTDIFSLGATFYQMFTGLSPAFRFMAGGGGLETLQERAYLPAIFAANYLGNLGPKSGGPQKINPFVPSWLDEVILKATDPEPERRYLSVAEMESVFRRYAPRTEITYNIRELNIGDKYTAGQIVGQGPNAHAHDTTVDTLWNQLNPSINVSQLANELSILRQQLRREAFEAEHDITLSEVAKAELAANAGDGPKTLAHLRAAGKWALEVATKIGTTIAADALKASLGLK